MASRPTDRQGQGPTTWEIDPQRTGAYAFDFTVNNLSKEAADYAFRASINTMAVETVGGEDYMSDSAYGLMPEVTFTTDAAVRYVYDLNGDGEADIKDAEALLAVANQTNSQSLSEEDTVKYDFDGDGEIASEGCQNLHAQPPGRKGRGGRPESVLCGGGG